MPVSYSQLSLYRRCPKQYEYACVLKLPRPLSRGESFGSSIHNTLRKFGLLELEHAPKTSAKQLPLFTESREEHHRLPLSLQTLLGFWRESFIAEGYEGRSAMDEALRSGEAALRHFFEWWSRSPRSVVAIEKGFSLSVPESSVVLSGRFDRVERTDAGLLIIDFKSGKPRPEEELTKDLQLSIYALAAADLWDEPIDALMLLSVTEEGIVEQRTVRNRTMLDEALETIRTSAGKMATKDFTATPSVTLCRHCPYRDICPSAA